MNRSLKGYVCKLLLGAAVAAGAAVTMALGQGAPPGVPPGLCQNGQWVPIGMGYECVPNQQQQIQRFNPNQQLQQPNNIYNNALTREAERIGSLFVKNPFQPNVSPDNQPIADNKTVSAALQEMLSSAPAPAPPINYSDPFHAVGSGNNAAAPSAAAAPAPAETATVPNARVNDNLNNIGTMPMQPAPSVQGSGGAGWQNPDPYNTHCTGAYKC